VDLRSCDGARSETVPALRIHRWCVYIEHTRRGSALPLQDEFTPHHEHHISRDIRRYHPNKMLISTFLLHVRPIILALDRLLAQALAQVHRILPDDRSAI